MASNDALSAIRANAPIGARDVAAAPLTASKAREADYLRMLTSTLGAAGAASQIPTMNTPLVPWELTAEAKAAQAGLVDVQALVTAGAQRASQVATSAAEISADTANKVIGEAQIAAMLDQTISEETALLAQMKLWLSTDNMTPNAQEAKAKQTLALADLDNTIANKQLALAAADIPAEGLFARWKQNLARPKLIDSLNDSINVYNNIASNIDSINATAQAVTDANIARMPKTTPAKEEAEANKLKLAAESVGNAAKLKQAADSVSYTRAVMEANGQLEGVAASKVAEVVNENIRQYTSKNDMIRASNNAKEQFTRENAAYYNMVSPLANKFAGVENFLGIPPGAGELYFLTLNQSDPEAARALVDIATIGVAADQAAAARAVLQAAPTTANAQAQALAVQIAEKSGAKWKFLSDKKLTGEASSLDAWEKQSSPAKAAANDAFAKSPEGRIGMAFEQTPVSNLVAEIAKYNGVIQLPAQLEQGGIKVAVPARDHRLLPVSKEALTILGATNADAGVALEAFAQYAAAKGLKAKELQDLATQYTNFFRNVVDVDTAVNGGVRRSLGVKPATSFMANVQEIKSGLSNPFITAPLVPKDQTNYQEVYIHLLRAVTDLRTPFKAGVVLGNARAISQ